MQRMIFYTVDPGSADLLSQTLKTDCLAGRFKYKTRVRGQDDSDCLKEAQLQPVELAFSLNPMRFCAPAPLRDSLQISSEAFTSDMHHGTLGEAL